MSAAVTDSDLARLDGALTDLRRLWEQPAVRRRFAELLGRSVELSVLRVLRAIASCPDDPGVARVADLLRVDQSTASRAVDAAVAGGYVDRGASQADRRRSVLGLTSEGRALLAASHDARTALLAEATRSWPDSDVATLATLLDRFVTAVTTTLEPTA